MKIRTLIVDDSPTMRAILANLLGSESDIEIVGAAANAAEARTMIRELDPDVITLDIEMPGMNGLEFLKKIMELKPKPVIIVSSHTGHGADVTMRALQAGAFDCYDKSSGGDGNLLNGDNGVLARIVRLADRHGVHRVQQPVIAQAAAEATTASHSGSRKATRVIGIGASTGGVEALTRLLGQWPEDCPPTLIVQHISGALAGALAKRLNGISPARVKLAEADIFLQPGHVYLAPGNERHLVVRGRDRLIAKLIEGAPVSGHRPSIDALFESIAKTAGSAATGVLLTGMGDDGARGLLAMRKAGCTTIAQDEASSVIYGMPRVANEIGAAQQVVGLAKMTQAVFA